MVLEGDCEVKVLIVSDSRSLVLSLNEKGSKMVVTVISCICRQVATKVPVDRWLGGMSTQLSHRSSNAQSLKDLTAPPCHFQTILPVWTQCTLVSIPHCVLISVDADSRYNSHH